MSSNLTSPRRRLSNGTSEQPDLVSTTRALDTRFYTGNRFPGRYRNGAFPTLHGS